MRKDTKKKTTVKDLKKAAEDAQQAWLDKNPPEKIESRVQELLDHNLQKIVLGLMGFEHRWNRWEVDHCNGRSGNSAAGDYLRSCAAAAIDKWFRSINLEKVKPPKCLISSMKKELENQVRRELLHMVSSVAHNRAAELFEEFMSGFTSEWASGKESEEEQE